jgi:lipopolysaccharide assembly protein A
MRILVWLIRVALFFTLFAFALNNQQEVSVHWFFNQEWRAPMVFVVLAVFTLGCVLGGLAMAPSWWRHRRIARSHLAQAKPTELTPPATDMSIIPTTLDSSHPPAHGI